MDELVKLMQEAVDRCRRIETRQAKHLAAIGFDTGVRRPVWVSEGNAGFVDAPSAAISLVDCLSVIPADLDPDYEVAVMFRGQLLGCVLRP